jgi:hypothetical protein
MKMLNSMVHGTPACTTHRQWAKAMAATGLPNVPDAQGAEVQAKLDTVGVYPPCNFQTNLPPVES